MTCAEFTIYQGDTGPILRPRPSVLDDGVTLDANWACWIAVNDADGVAVIAKRAVTDKTGDSLRFVAALTPAETGTLIGGVDYTMIIEVINATTTPPFNIEKHYTLKVSAQGID